MTEFDKIAAIFSNLQSLMVPLLVGIAGMIWRMQQSVTALGEWAKAHEKMCTERHELKERDHEHTHARIQRIEDRIERRNDGEQRGLGR